MTTRMQCLDESHVESIEKCMELANAYFWKLTIVEIPTGTWHVRSGDQPIFTADSREAVDAFLYGMGLAYAVIPTHLFQKLVADTKPLVS